MPFEMRAQQDSINLNPEKRTTILSYAFRDSTASFSKDSMKRVADSLRYFWIRPDMNRPNQFVDSLVKLYEVKNLDFQAWADQFIPKKNREAAGKYRKQGEQWIMITVLFLLFGFASMRLFFGKDIQLILNAFYDTRLFNQSVLGGNLFNTWPFIFLNLLFGLSVGMYLFLVGKFFDLDYALDGWKWYLLLSLSVVGLFTLKIYVLRILGFLLEIHKIVRFYISILFLTYFHAAILFLPLILAFSLSPLAYAHTFLYAGLLLTALLIIYQLFRVSAQLLAQQSFPKFYLFIYFCALEICPILIIIKALRF
jgi:hypothetical protein